MSPKPQTYDIVNFPLGARVNISDIPEFQGVTIDRISDSGVTISGPRCGHNVVVSAKSPAFLATEEPAVSKVEKSVASVQPEEESVRAPRGTYKDKMENIQVPEGPFTIKQIAEINGIPPPYAFAWVKENCVAVGQAEKVEGQRGRAATLYTKK